MKVRNIHERRFSASEPVGQLIDSLASRDDALWPTESWPRMAFDRPLQVGAIGGHGPIRYVVEAYAPQRSIRFRFTRPRGFDGTHGYHVLSTERDVVVLRHTLEMKTSGFALLSWPLVFRPLHDALIEDSLAKGEASLGYPASNRPWSRWVRLLRALFSLGRS